jgi:hypothetical protein
MPDNETPRVIVNEEKWQKRYAVVALGSTEDFQLACHEASAHNFSLHSWRDLFSESCGYCMTVVFERGEH